VHTIVQPYLAAAGLHFLADHTTGLGTVNRRTSLHSANVVERYYLDNARAFL
jgi:hypothetical protein